MGFTLPRMICPRSQNGTMNNISKAAPAPMAICLTVILKT